MADLTLAEVARLQALGPERYQQQVMSLFASGRASRVQWEALAAAVLIVSESDQGAVVTAIDCAILAHLAAQE